MKLGALNIGLTVTLLFAAQLSAETLSGRPKGGHRGPPPFMKECAAELGITLPDRNSSTITANQAPSEEVREQLRSCQEAKRTKMEACLTEKGISKPEPGSGRPDETTKAAIDACHAQVAGTTSASTDSDSTLQSDSVRNGSLMQSSSSSGVR